MALSVLIVDDDPHVRRVLRMELEAAGFRVVDEAADGSRRW
jgi:CheY-like chemotaxis protein